MLTTHAVAIDHACLLRIEEVGPTSRCLGTQCMAWRWHDRPPMTNCTTRSKKIPEPGAPVTLEHMSVPPGNGWKPIGNPMPPDPSGEQGRAWVQNWTRDHDAAQTERRGYCGLAGKPEL